MRKLWELSTDVTLCPGRERGGRKKVGEDRRNIPLTEKREIPEHVDLVSWLGLEADVATRKCTSRSAARARGGER
jgi:hypothetical protein